MQTSFLYLFKCCDTNVKVSKVQEKHKNSNKK